MADYLETLALSGGEKRIDDDRIRSHGSIEASAATAAARSRRLHEWVTTVDHKKSGLYVHRLCPALSRDRRASKR